MIALDPRAGGPPDDDVQIFRKEAAARTFYRNLISRNYLAFIDINGRVKTLPLRI